MPRKLTPTPKPIQLNEEQQTLVNTRVGVFQALACPGAGKTACLISRWIALIEEGTDPNQILNLTFTASAAKNLRDRVEQRTGKLVITRVGAGAMTFHAWSLAFTMEERENFPFKLADFPLATEPVAMKFSGDAARRYEVDPRTLRNRISLWKRNRTTPADALRDAEQSGKPDQIKLALGFKEYDRKLRDNGVLDFDSLMTEAVNLLDRNKEVRDRWQYQYVMADESQDNCSLDWKLLQLVTEKHGNLLCVGDPGQSIYGFRGSSPSLFLNMDQMFPGTTKLFLATNYRSTPEIISLLKAIGPVPELAERFHTPNPSGPEPVVTGYKHAFEEAAVLVEAVRKMDGNQVAILARTNRALVPVEQALSEAGVRYFNVGHTGFYQQPEIRAVVAWLACTQFPADWALAAAIRSPFDVVKYLPKSKLCARLKELDESYWHLLTKEPYSLVENKNLGALQEFTRFVGSLVRYKNLPPKDALRGLLQSLDAFSYYAKEEATPDSSPSENLSELLKIAEKHPTIREFLDYVHKCSAASKGRKGVAVSTIHGFKGLERPIVHIVQCNEGIIPHAKATDLSEERNIWFVACSRPERELRISYNGVPSPFLKDYIK